MSNPRLLTKEEEVELGRRIQKGDNEAKNRMITSNLGLVGSIASHYAGRGLDEEDLFQEGIFGLHRAAEKFDPDMGYKFSTYATWWVRQSITRAIKTHRSTVRIPDYKLDEIVSWEKATQYLIGELGREPTMYDIASLLDMPKDHAIEVEKAFRISKNSKSLNYNEDDRKPLLNFIPADQASPVNQAIKNIEISDLGELMQSVLDERSIRIVEKRFTLEMTLKEISQQEGIGRERVRQIVEESLRTLRSSSCASTVPSVYEWNERAYRLPLAEARRIVLAYEECEGRTRIASRALGHTPVTIGKYWRWLGLTVTRSGGGILIPRSSKREIVAAHETYGANAAEATRNLPYSYHTILKYWRLAGLKPLSPEMSSRKVKDEHIPDIEAAYNTFNGNGNEASRHLPFSRSTVVKVWESKGLPLRRRSLQHDDIEHIISSYQEYNGNAKEASRHLGYNKSTISKYWNRAGLKTLNQPHLTQEERSEIVESYKLFNGNAHAASKSLEYPVITILYNWRKAGLEIGKSGVNKRYLCA